MSERIEGELGSDDFSMSWGSFRARLSPEAHRAKGELAPGGQGCTNPMAGGIPPADGFVQHFLISRSPPICEDLRNLRAVSPLRQQFSSRTRQDGNRGDDNQVGL